MQNETRNAISVVTLVIAIAVLGSSMFSAINTFFADPKPVISAVYEESNVVVEVTCPKDFVKSEAGTNFTPYYTSPFGATEYTYVVSNDGWTTTSPIPKASKKEYVKGALSEDIKDLQQILINTANSINEAQHTTCVPKPDGK